MYYKRDGNYDRYIVYAIDDMEEYVEFVVDIIPNVVREVAVNKLPEEIIKIINKCKKIE